MGRTPTDTKGNTAQQTHNAMRNLKEVLTGPIKPYKNRKENTLTLCSYNMRGLNGKTHWLEQLGESAHIIGIQETWIKDRDIELRESIPAEVHPKESYSGLLRRGHGGVALKLQPLMRYQIVDEYCTHQAQYVTIKTRGISVTSVYLSPSLKKAEETEILNKLMKGVRGQAVIMGDLNARNRKWDTKTNPRGTRLKQAAEQEGWEIKTPSEPTCFTHNGSSSPDLFITKGITGNNVRVLKGGWEGTSDHEPIAIEIASNIPRGTSKQRTTIPMGERNNPRRVEVARTLYSAELPRVTKQFSECKSEAEMNQAYKRFQEVILRPWHRIPAASLHRHKSCWSKALHKLGSQRANLYRKYKRSRSAEDEERYKEIEKRIKEAVRSRKAKRMERVRESIETETKKDLTTTISMMMRRAQKLRKGSEVDNLKLSDFTKHMTTAREERQAPKNERFTVDSTLQAEIQRAIETAPKKKATGNDGIFVEALTIMPQETSRALYELWAKCGELNCTPLEWGRAIMVPIYKKGDTSMATSYRPIALLSHTRKVVEKAISKVVQKQYKNRPSQLGFQEGTGPETALIRHIRNTDRRPYCAVLDLKAAYDRVPRLKLMAVLGERLPPNLCNMIAQLLQPITITTAGDDTGKTGLIAKGVVQGSPLSPSLFNAYMDTLVDSISRSARTEGEEPKTTEVDLTLFADDVKVQTNTLGQMKETLSTAEKWATMYGMEWSGSKCHLLGNANSGSHEPISFGGATLELEERTTYLGVTISHNGTVNTRSTERLQSARACMSKLREMGFNHKTMNTSQMRRVALTFLLPIATYGAHLVPYTELYVKSWERMEDDVIQTILGWTVKTRRNRLRSLLRLPSMRQWVGMRHESLADRLERKASGSEATEEERKDKRIWRTVRNKLGWGETNRKADIIKEWKDSNRKSARSTPKTTHKTTPPALDLPNVHVRISVARWYVNVYPIHPSAIVGREGQEGRRHLNEMRRLTSLTKLSEKDEETLEKTIEWLDENQPLSWRPQPP